ncbi:hypothetical protein Q3G72_033768 [Acer saccharum]|nr:hypothetical protein Q3G72_033768 [Acer saccharum]
MRQVEGGSQTRETSRIHTEPPKGVLVDRETSEGVKCGAREGMREVVLHVHGATIPPSNVDSGEGRLVFWKDRQGLTWWGEKGTLKHSPHKRRFSVFLLLRRAIELELR